MTNIINIGGVDCYEQDGTVYLKLESVARGLGFTDNKDGIEYVRWARIDKYLKELNFATCGEISKRPEFIPENIFYRLAMKAKNETAEKFQALVADEIIPTIRRTGGYVNNDEQFINTYLPFADDNTKLLFATTLQTIREQNALCPPSALRPQPAYICRTQSRCADRVPSLLLQRLRCHKR